MTKTCIICGGDEAGGDQLLQAPCQRHWVCTDDVSSFFQRAAENESLYPPKCCGQLFLLDEYEAHVPFEVSWAYQKKAQGEYSVLAKYRVYCANPACSEFLGPATHVKDPFTDTSYAVCHQDTCGKLTCTACKTLVDGVGSHTCEHNDDYKKFKQTATEKGFQECPTCASTVELAEACNHVTCECGAQFCYICGMEWQGMHGCPHYGPAVYDEDGYNQDGFHRITGLNRAERTRHEQFTVDHEDDGESDNEDDAPDDEDGGNGLDFDAEQRILQHVGPPVREVFDRLPREERDIFLINLQIHLFEAHGISVNTDPTEGDGQGQIDDDDDDEESADSDPEVDASNNGDEDGDGPNNSAEQQENGNGSLVGNMEKGGAEDDSSDRPEDAHAAGMQSAGSSTESHNASSVQAMEVSAEADLGVHEYLTRLTRASLGDAADEHDITAVDRRAELARTLQRIQADLEQGVISSFMAYETLGTLYDRFPANEQVFLLRQSLASAAQNRLSNSSATSPEDGRPATPMDIDSVDGQKEARQLRRGLPGGWPDDLYEI